MSQQYSNPARETEPYALPDVEVFYVEENELESDILDVDEGGYLPAGWYWWSCFPGCLPDSDPSGPFATEQEALDDAQDY